jgi:KDO2-lipid IV(A) lauroyltransferase
VLTYFVERLPGRAGYRATISPILANFPGADVRCDVERFNQVLEAHIMKVPDQYLWMHRRFKGLSIEYPNYYGRDARRRTAAAPQTSAS